MNKNFYAVHNRLLLWGLKCIDRIYQCKKAPQKVPIFPNLVKGVLISNIAHLGDVIIATSAIRVIKEAYPNAKIGFLTSSDSRKAIHNHPDLSKIHIFDHFKHNRSKIPWLVKLWRHRKSFRCALMEIQKEGYDIAIDLYCYFPNSIRLLYRAAIPTRVGFTSGGFGPLLTHGVSWKLQNQQMQESYKELFERLFIDPPLFQSLTLDLKKTESDICKRHHLNEYMIFHPGSIARHKEWQIEKWKELLDRFENEGCRVIFTGHGEEEYQQVQKISPHAFNLCNQLNWEDYVEIVRCAKLVICVDTDRKSVV